VRCFIELIAVPTAGDDHDRVRVFERGLVLRPSVEVHLDAHLFADARSVEQYFEEFHGPQIVVDAIAFGSVALLPRN
jgi:hypothetical protein